MYGHNRYGTTRYGAVHIVGGASSKSLSAIASALGAVGRTTHKSALGSVAAVSVIVRKASKAISAASSVVGTVDRATTYLKALAVATATVTGVVGRTAKKGLSGAVTGAGQLARAVRKSISGIVAGTGQVIRKTSRTFVSAVSAAGTVARIYEAAYIGGVVATAAIGKLIHKTISATVAATATLPRFVYDMNWAMNRTIRQIFAKVRLTLTDPYFSGGVDVSSPTGVGRETYLDQTADNVDTTAFKWFSLHRNVLDGTFHLLPTGKEYSVGWWGTVLSDAVTREFTPNPVLQIVVAPRTVDSLLVVGDERLNEYPTDFWIRLYSAGDTLEYEWHEEGNTLVRWEKALSPPETDIVKITLTIEKWNRAGAVSKIIQFFTAIEETLYSENGDLISVRVNEEREYAGATIPQGNISSSSITVRFNNIKDLFSPGNWGSRFYGLLKNNRAIKAWLGVDILTERFWYPLGLFYSRDWSAPEDEIWAEVTGLDTLDRLRSTTFNSSTVYENKSLQWLAIEIMTDAGLTDVDWDIDPALDAIVVPYAWFEPMSHREALRRIAAAALGQVYCNRDGVIVVEIYSVPATSSFTFDRSNIFSIDHPLKWAQMVNYVEAQASPLEKQSEQVICTDIEPFIVPGNGTITKTHFFTTSPCVETVIPVLTDADAHITVDSWTPYAWGMMVTYANSDPADEEVRQVNISGKPLIVVGGKVAVAQDATSIADNGKQSLSEPLTSEFWQTEERAQACADAILASYKDPRRDVTMRTRGNIALKLGDRIVAPDYKDTVISEFGIMRQDIQWDGGLEVTIGAQRASDAMYYYKKGIEGRVKTVGVLDKIARKTLDALVLCGRIGTGLITGRKTVEASVAATSSLEKEIGKGIETSVETVGALHKAVRKVMTVLVESVGTIGMLFILERKFINTSVVAAGSLYKKIGKSIDASVETVAILQKGSAKVISTTVMATGTVIRMTTKAFNAVVETVGLLNKMGKKTMSKSIEAVGVIEKRVKKPITVLVGAVGTFAKQASNYYKTLASAVATIGSAQRAGYPLNIGPGAVDRAYGLPPDYTIIDKANPADSNGVLTSVEIWADDTMADVRVGTFYGSGTDYTCRDYAEIGQVTAGSKQTFPGLSIDVHVGDMLGIFYSSGHLDYDTAGGSGILFISGDQTETAQQTYDDSHTGYALSIYGEGTGHS